MTKSPPIAGSVGQANGTRQVPIGWLFLFLLTLTVPLWGLVTSSSTILDLMLAKGWGRAMGAQDSLGLLAQCLISNACSGVLQKGVLEIFPHLTWIAPGLGLVVYALKSKPRTFAVRDPGTAWWAQSGDKGLKQYMGDDPKRATNRLHGYLGHLMSVERTGEINYRNTIPLYVRMEALAENVLILGGVGAGKTRGYFRPLLMLAAHLGFHVIVFDLKYPQTDSGFFDMVGYWKKAGKRVMMFTPFSDNTQRLPLLDSVEDYASALSMATTIMPPPEYGAEPGKHYRDRDRGVLAAFLLWVARSDDPSFGQLLLMAQYTPEEMQNWFDKETKINKKGEVVQNLKGVFGQGKQEVAAVLQGIKNALRIFFNPKVARATTSKEGENMDIRAAFRGVTTMIYVGIQQEYMMEGDGVVLLQLTKRYIDKQLQREAEFQGGRLRKHVAYVMDEFPSFGQLPYMMRSLGVLRSYNVSHHIGVQNLKQLAVVYGTDYSQALTTNVIGRKIFFPLAVEDEEREIFSKYLGMTTVYDISETDSRRAFLGSSMDETTRQGVSYRKVAVPLLPPEQFPHFRPMEAIVKGRGVNPVRVFMPAIEDEFLDGDDIPGGIKNGLFMLYQLCNPERLDMGDYTQELVRSGALGTAQGRAEDEIELTQKGKVFQEWLLLCLEANVPMRFSGPERRLYLNITDLEPEHLPKAFIEGNYMRGWTAKPTSDQIRITSSGLDVLDDEVRGRLERRATFGVLEYWLETNKELVEGTEARASVPEESRREAQAILKIEEGEVWIRRLVCRELFGKAPRVLFRRVGTVRFVLIDLKDPEAFLDLLAQAEDEDDDQEEGDGKAAAPTVDQQQAPLPFKAPHKVPETPGWIHDEVEAMDGEIKRVEDGQSEL
ncbi:type IV secretory system conjugative DNA transfer family protein [Deinococcus sp. Leaf326]|uniref:type IV secretory system conjugative DNA transfer family protein n=1 Tax=Deinococcus sp. Leaf326 TaxID=1736338 RepID=UPI0006FE0BF6|nr:type IV secretory system conjugative DNA transfer family protein [Deinococcus sp. Leaf326]KQR25604.1 hypothetical protein ASF71_18900 [Deinococcus sp. Leaf326]